MRGNPPWTFQSFHHFSKNFQNIPALLDGIVRGTLPNDKATRFIALVFTLLQKLLTFLDFFLELIGCRSDDGNITNFWAWEPLCPPLWRIKGEWCNLRHFVQGKWSYFIGKELLRPKTSYIAIRGCSTNRAIKKNAKILNIFEKGWKLWKASTLCPSYCYVIKGRLSTTHWR